MKSLFEKMGGAYTQIGDYFLRDLNCPKKKQDLSRHMGNIQACVREVVEKEIILA